MNTFGVTNYEVGAFLIKLKNAAMAKNKSVVVRMDKKTVAIATALKKMGFISEVVKNKESLQIDLTFKDKSPLLQDIKLISKPGLRVYQSVKELEAKKSPSQLLVSTPKGMISGREAIKQRTGGEVIAEIL